MGKKYHGTWKQHQTHKVRRDPDLDDAPWRQAHPLFVKDPAAKAFLGGLRTPLNDLGMLKVLNQIFQGRVGCCELIGKHARNTRSGTLVFAVFFKTPEDMAWACEMGPRIMPKDWAIRQGGQG